MRFVIIASLLFLSPAIQAESPTASLSWFQKVSDSPGHHAFTDLAYFKGHYYLCNRVGTGHVSMDGVIQIRRSTDMKNWEDCGVIKTIGDDRDPHFAATPEKLYVFFGVWDTTHGDGDRPIGRNNVRSHVASSEDGTAWSKVQGIYEPGWWLWRVRHINGTFYSAAYTALRPVPTFRETRLLKSDDGIQWDFVSTVTKENMSGEADFWLRDEESIGLISRTGKGQHARFFSSDASFRVWENVELNAMVHSPVLAFWHDRIFVAGRGEEDGKHVTKFWELKGATLHEMLSLPSGGDNAYPGLLTIPESLDEGPPRFYISWYSRVDAVTGENEPKGGAGVYVGEIVLGARTGK
ncbi:MAG: hypothetical protein L3K26_20050 [Candidatus Hydrogenedentes bacterium]|nr:hypothetical protein [Candidatus Hydrogenedentota bacterium]